MKRKHLRTIRSFVCREGRMTEAQLRALNQYYDRYGIKTSHKDIDIEKIFEYRCPLIVDIGFGMGDSLYQLALQHSDMNFFGIEVHRPGVGALLIKLEEARINNVRLCMEDAMDVLADTIADNAITAILIYFPDPWHKRRHHKRRLIQESFLNLIHKKLIHKGEIHISTDCSEYARHIMKCFHNISVFQRLSKSSSQYAIQRPNTKFATRGLKLGHKIFDFIYSKQ